jgi:DNA-directed RNA polymerase specialized sigma24 family protein
MSKDAAEESLWEPGRSNPDALVRFATRWWVPVYRICWNMLGNTAEAAAVTEETLLRELRSGKPARVPRRMSLYRLATWLALVRRRAGVPPMGRRSTTLQALDHLDDRDRAALVLRDGERLQAEEVATILGTSAADVRARVHRARLVLAGRMSLMSAARGAIVPRALSRLPC